MKKNCKHNLLCFTTFVLNVRRTFSRLQTPVSSLPLHLSSSLSLVFLTADERDKRAYASTSTRAFGSIRAPAVINYLLNLRHWFPFNAESYALNEDRYLGVWACGTEGRGESGAEVGLGALINWPFFNWERNGCISEREKLSRVLIGESLSFCSRSRITAFLAQTAPRRSRDPGTERVVDVSFSRTSTISPDLYLSPPNLSIASLDGRLIKFLWELMNRMLS